jgi:cation:H+ antiporter
MLVVFQIIAGFILLLLGGEALVRAAVKIAREYNISKLVIGVTIVAFGTSSPELLITLQASIKESYDIALGNVIGSNIANIFLILGIAAILYPIKVQKELVKFDIHYMIIASIMLFLFVMTGVIGRIEGVILIAILLIYTISTLKRHKNNNNDMIALQVSEVEEQSFFEISKNMAILLVIVSIIFLGVGAHILVVGASDLARMFGVSEAAIAVTIVALGGSAPELATSVIAAYRKHSDIAVANVVGSNIFNIFAVIGFGALINPIISRSTLSFFDVWVMLFAALLFYSYVRKKYEITRLNGISFCFFYVLYIIWQFAS